jgi:hypothetical protein
LGFQFLAWDDRPEGDPDKHDPPAEGDLEVLVDQVQSLVMAVGERGCGYEAPLEAMYRFLVDPAPYESLAREGDVTVQRGTDQVVLDQRKEFLRPDSALVVVILGDENDCSIRDEGYGWLAGKTTLNVGTSACAADPDDPCCTYCGFAEAPEGCPPIESDPACAASDNYQNIRCWDQKRRFGIDFLYPVTRYVAGFKDGKLCPDSSAQDGDCRCRHAEETGEACDPGSPVANPIYQDLKDLGREIRDPSLITVLSIVGVPWQDLATEDTLDPELSELRYKPASEVDWSLILATPATGDAPLDILMLESVTPRLSSDPHPITGVAPAPPHSADAWANPINGHEWSPQNNEDLQHACMFELAPLLEGEIRDCNVIGNQTCECFDTTDGLMQVRRRQKPLCQGEDGVYSSVQLRAKAYPGVRQVDLMRRLEESGSLASICPKVLDADPSDMSYGYNPAVLHLARRMKGILK